MAKLLGAKAGKLTIQDALFIAGTKIFSERILSPFIGNGSVVSGGVKLVGAGLVRSMAGGKVGDILGTALGVDGAEDIVSSFLGDTGAGLLGSRTQQVQVI